MNIKERWDRVCGISAHSRVGVDDREITVYDYCISSLVASVWEAFCEQLGN